MPAGSTSAVLRGQSRFWPLTDSNGRAKATGSDSASGVIERDAGCGRGVWRPIARRAAGVIHRQHEIGDASPPARKAELKQADMTYDDLADGLKKHGLKETEA
jgi:hypothetical protein